MLLVLFREFLTVTGEIWLVIITIIEIRTQSNAVIEQRIMKIC